MLCLCESGFSVYMAGPGIPAQLKCTAEVHS